MRTAFLSALLAAPVSGLAAPPVPDEKPVSKPVEVKRELFTDFQGFKFTKTPDTTSGQKCSSWCDNSKPAGQCGDPQCAGCSACAAWGMGPKFCDSWCETKANCVAQKGVATYKTNAASCSGCNFCGGSLYPGGRKVPVPFCSKTTWEFTEDDCYGYTKELDCNLQWQQVCPSVTPPFAAGSTTVRISSSSLLRTACPAKCPGQAPLTTLA